jgi:cysteine sulfinate desulfinase/cysteine desulfurase-like protein
MLNLSSSKPQIDSIESDTDTKAVEEVINDLTQYTGSMEFHPPRENSEIDKDELKEAIIDTFMLVHYGTEQNRQVSYFSVT